MSMDAPHLHASDPSIQLSNRLLLEQAQHPISTASQGYFVLREHYLRCSHKYRLHSLLSLRQSGRYSSSTCRFVWVWARDYCNTRDSLIQSLVREIFQTGWWWVLIFSLKLFLQFGSTFFFEKNRDTLKSLARQRGGSSVARQIPLKRNDSSTGYSRLVWFLFLLSSPTVGISLELSWMKKRGGLSSRRAQFARLADMMLFPMKKLTSEPRRLLRLRLASTHF